MGWGRFPKKQEELMESFLKGKTIHKKEVSGYPHQIKSLLRKGMIKKHLKNYYKLTNRGKSAISQQIKVDRYWVAPLGTYKRLGII